MKFLCTKVKEFWLSSPNNCEKVTKSGLKIKDPFIGIVVKDGKPTEKEYNLVNNAIEKLFGDNKKAFPIRLIDI